MAIYCASTRYFRRSTKLGAEIAQIRALFPAQSAAQNCSARLVRSPKRSGKSTGLCWPRAPRGVESVARAHLLTAASMPAEPHIRSPFSERLAPQSLILEVIGLGRVGPHCMAAYCSHCSRRSTRPDPTRLIRPRGTRDNDPAFPGASDWLHDSTRRDLAMVDISREGNEQFAGERDDRDAAGPAALGANALAEPTAESTGRLVSHPHPGKLEPLWCADADCLPSRYPVLGQCCHSSMGWEPGRHTPPTAVGSQSGGTDPQGRAR
jgi:hypothetical protein